jgi:hypothetical protein
MWDIGNTVPYFTFCAGGPPIGVVVSSFAAEVLEGRGDASGTSSTDGDR